MNDKEYAEVVRIFHEQGGNKTATGQIWGVSPRTIGRWLEIAEERNLLPHKNKVIIDELPPAMMTDEELFEFRVEQTTCNIEREDAKNWRKVHLDTDLPIGLAIFGDPHLDNKNANLLRFKHHLEIVAGASNRVYCVNIGDVLDNWKGNEKLAQKKCDDNGLSYEDGLRMVNYVLNQSGVNWLVWLHGNHEAWNQLTRIVELMGKNKPSTIFEYWEAKIVLSFSNSVTYRLWARHNFKGTSQWSKIIGLNKAARLLEEADLYCAGHTHEFGYGQEYIAERNLFPTTLRVRGYKTHDDYAKTHGFANGNDGEMAFIVIDPLVVNPNHRTTVFADPQKGLMYLDMLRQHYAGSSNVE